MELKEKIINVEKNCKKKKINKSQNAATKI